MPWRLRGDHQAHALRAPPVRGTTQSTPHCASTEGRRERMLAARARVVILPLASLSAGAGCSNAKRMAA